MKILISLLFLFMSTSFAYASNTNPWQNVCPDTSIIYCKNVGKYAHNGTGSPPALKGIKLGKIIGVAWRPKGSKIGYSKPIPEANIPGSTRLSPKNAYYYIIDDGMADAQGQKKPPFLRQCREIDAKKEKLL